MWEDDVESSATILIDQVLNLVQEEKWEQAIDLTLKDAPRRLSLPQSFFRFGGIVMATACYKTSVPLHFFQTVLQVSGKESATYQDAGLRTPLHMVLMYLDRPDICRLLVETNPLILNVNDHVGLRPIDIITQKIVMKEELMRYLSKSIGNGGGASFQTHAEIDAESRLLENCWESARILCLAHGGELTINNNNNNNNACWPLLHACCLSRRHVPLSLVHRALCKCGSAQLELQDDIRGETPLHIVSRNTVEDAQQQPEDADDEELELLALICMKNPKAAGILNENNQYPLDVAIQTGRTWNTGCQFLAQAYPPALLHGIHDENEVRIFFQSILLGHFHNQEFFNDMIFQVLRSRPQIILLDP